MLESFHFHLGVVLSCLFSSSSDFHDLHSQGQIKVSLLRKKIFVWNSTQSHPNIVFQDGLSTIQKYHTWSYITREYRRVNQSKCFVLNYFFSGGQEYSKPGGCCQRSLLLLGQSWQPLLLTTHSVSVQQLDSTGLVGFCNGVIMCKIYIAYQKFQGRGVELDKVLP